MSKVKQYYTDETEKKVDDILHNFTSPSCFFSFTEIYCTEKVKNPFKEL